MLFLGIFQLSGGDDKLMLRLQNKYRNTLKKNPEKILAIERELFGKEGVVFKKQAGMSASNGGTKSILKGEEARELLQKRLEKEINALYDRLAKALKAENARLLEENAMLRQELERLRKKLH